MDIFTEKVYQSMPKDREVLELDEYVDLLLKITGDIGKEYRNQMGILNRGEENFPEEISYRSPLASMMINNAGKDTAEIRKQLMDVFVRQDDFFLRQNSNISSSYVQKGFLPHFHKNAYFDVIYVEDGQGVCVFRSESLQLKKGDVLIVPPEVEHGEGARERNDLVLTSAIRRDNFLEMFLQVFSENQMLYSFFSRILNGDESISYILFRVSDYDPDERLKEFFHELYTEQTTEKAYYNEMCNTIMRAIFVHLLRYYSDSLVLPEANAGIWKKEYAYVFQYIEEHYRTVSLDDLEREFHYSKRQLIRIIKMTTGSNFAELLQDMKLKRAKLLLKETGMTIEDITMECGYENASSFARLFKSKMGMTPKQYRNHVISDSRKESVV